MKLPAEMQEIGTYYYTEASFAPTEMSKDADKIPLNFDVEVEFLAPLCIEEAAWYQRLWAKISPKYRRQWPSIKDAVIKFQIQ